MKTKMEKEEEEEEEEEEAEEEEEEEEEEEKNWFAALQAPSSPLYKRLNRNATGNSRLKKKYTVHEISTTLGHDQSQD
ncbi:hypothetical protein V1477_007796 [Vespula maculifrons]|uniref:Uncharacterized protein n=1 Tax=Vespula maculifrons TaxID=7453 RepID=A0ABD2CGH5_VESMC